MMELTIDIFLTQAITLLLENNNSDPVCSRNKFIISN